MLPFLTFPSQLLFERRHSTDKLTKRNNSPIVCRCFSSPFPLFLGSISGQPTTIEKRTCSPLLLFRPMTDRETPLSRLWNRVFLSFFNACASNTQRLLVGQRRLVMSFRLYSPRFYAVKQEFDNSTRQKRPLAVSLPSTYMRSRPWHYPEMAIIRQRQQRDNATRRRL